MVLNNHVQIAEAWIAMHIAGTNSPIYEENFWAYEQLDNFIHNDPQQALDVILKVIEINSSELILSNLGAGPIEDLMCYKGNEVISKIKDEAKGNANFKKALASTWLDSNDTPHLKEFYETAGVEPPFKD
jgi:hypothetical protein